MTLEDVLVSSRSRLAEADVPEAALDAWYLFENITGFSRAYYETHRKEEFPEKKMEELKEKLDKRAQRIPLQHILGETEFMGLKFYVNRDVLIPRQDTEVLVEETLKRMGRRSGLNVLDLCTGSGCIAVSIAEYKETANITAADLSADAIRTACRNADRNGAGQIRFACGDLFDAAFVNGGCVRDYHYDFIVSNPPYIPTAVIDTLMPEVRDHDPKMALDGKEDGLYFYRRIAAEGYSLLNKGGYMLLEIGFDQAESVTGFMKEQGFDEICVIKDLAGLDRVVCGRKQE